MQMSVNQAPESQIPAVFANPESRNWRRSSPGISELQKKTWQLSHIIMMHFGNGDKLNAVYLCGSRRGRWLWVMWCSLRRRRGSDIPGSWRCRCSARVHQYTPGYTPVYTPGYTPCYTPGYTPGYTLHGCRTGAPVHHLTAHGHHGPPRHAAVRHHRGPGVSYAPPRRHILQHDPATTTNETTEVSK